MVLTVDKNIIQSSISLRLFWSFCAAEYNWKYRCESEKVHRQMKQPTYEMCLRMNTKRTSLDIPGRVSRLKA